MKIIYRISDTSQGGHYKIKPEYINNENCLKFLLLLGYLKSQYRIL